MLTSEKLMFSLLDLNVNFIWPLTSFNYFIELLSFSLLWVNIKKTSYIPKPKKWLQFRRFKTIFLKLIHINVRIRWCIFCANSCSRNFMEYLLSKLRVLISENKFCHSKKSVGIFLFCLQLSPPLRASRATLCGMLRSKPTKSAVTKIEPWGIFPIL